MPQAAIATPISSEFIAFVAKRIDRRDGIGLFARCKSQLFAAGKRFCVNNLVVVLIHMHI